MFPRRYIIKVQGGAGNQLFQASYLFSKVSEKPGQIVLYTGALGRAQTKRSIYEPAWNLFAATRSSALLTRVVLKFSAKIAMFDRLLRRLNVVCIQGYFQDDVNFEYANRIQSAVKQDASSVPEFDLVVHCRGGDYLEPPNDEIYWQLRLENYLAEIEKAGHANMAVIGNHTEFSEDLTARGATPLKGSISGDLDLMGSSAKLICSNSTFAFWGAIFCLLNGGEVVVPSKYYKMDIGPNPFDSLARAFPERVTYFGGDNA